jgi:hypothetical protein
MRLYSRTGWLFALVVLTGCASTEVTSQQPYEGPRIARPDRIIVDDFAATPADVPPGSAVVGEYSAPSTPMTPEQIEEGRKLGAEVAKELVAKIQNMGLPAVQAAGQPPPRVGDLVIMGYFVSVHEGSAAKRVLIGFGSGAADLKTVVEGYLMTAQGLRRLGAGELDSGGGKTPGVAVPLAVAVATANPVGLIVSGAAKAYGEASGSATIEGTAERTADEIAEKLQVAFEKQGWISSSQTKSILIGGHLAHKDEALSSTGWREVRLDFGKKRTKQIG